MSFLLYDGKGGGQRDKTRLVLGSDQNDFAWLDEFQFFAGEFFNRGGIATQGLDFGVEFFVFRVDVRDFVLKSFEFLGPPADLQSAFVVEYGEKKHGYGE